MPLPCISTWMSTSDGHTERQLAGTRENHLDSMFPEHASTEPSLLETFDEAVGLYDWDGWEPTDTSFDTECDDNSISFTSNAPPRPSTPKYEDRGQVPSDEQLCLKYGTVSNISHISTLSSDVGCEISASEMIFGSSLNLASMDTPCSAYAVQCDRMPSTPCQKWNPPTCKAAQVCKHKISPPRVGDYDYDAAHFWAADAVGDDCEQKYVPDYKLQSPCTKRKTKKEMITREVLQMKFHLQRNEAAIELGIGLTYLKKLCRSLAITRWPSRKIQAILAVIEQLREMKAIERPAHYSEHCVDDKSIVNASSTEPCSEHACTNTGTDFEAERTMYIEAKIEKLLDLKKAIEIDPELPLGIDMNKFLQRTNCQVNGRKRRKISSWKMKPPDDVHKARALGVEGGAEERLECPDLPGV